MGRRRAKLGCAPRSHTSGRQHGPPRQRREAQRVEISRLSNKAISSLPMSIHPPPEGHTAASKRVTGPQAAAAGAGGLLRGRAVGPHPQQGIQSPPRPHPAPGKLKRITLRRGRPEAAGPSERAAGSRLQPCGSTGGGMQECRAAGSAREPCGVLSPGFAARRSRGQYRGRFPPALVAPAQKQGPRVGHHPRALRSLSRAMSSLEMGDCCSFHLKYI